MKRIRIQFLGLAAFLASVSMLSAAAEHGSFQPNPGFGVLVMAHGGTPAWNQAVLEAASALKDDFPVEVAFGMASAFSLQEATNKLEARGVDKIGVVRLFVSGDSWLERTRQILGLSPGAPLRSEAPAGHHSGHHDFRATFWQIETTSDFALSRAGLSEAQEMSQVLLDRVRDLSVDPETESVLLLAHGPGDDEENKRWIAGIEELVDPLQQLPFRAVRVQTLREDWAEKRQVAEESIRSFVKEAGNEGGRCLVIPFRVFGFGPYAKVLEGLEYVSDGRGLLPHRAVGDWILRQAQKLSKGPFEPKADRSPVNGAGDDDRTHAGVTAPTGS